MKAEDSELIRLLYEGVFEQPLWNSFLEQLRSRIGALYATIAFRELPKDNKPLSPEANAMVTLYAGEVPPIELSQFVDERYSHDQFPFHHMQDGCVSSLEILLESADSSEVSHYKEVMKRHHIGYTCFIQATDPSGLKVWLNVAGRQKDDSLARELLPEFAPHLRVAFHTYVVLEQQRLNSEVTSEAIRRLNFGWLTLNEDCQVVDLTPDVEHFLKHTKMLHQDQNERLIFTSPVLGKKIRELVKYYAENSAGKPHVLNLSRDPWTDMLIAPVQYRSITSRSRPVAIIYLRSDHQSQEDRYDQLVELFGLLRSEAKLAWAIVQGMSISEAAGYLGITVETARHYSKKVYAKTGTRGQAELVRTILTSVLALN